MVYCAFVSRSAAGYNQNEVMLMSPSKINFNNYKVQSLLAIPKITIC